MMNLDQVVANFSAREDNLGARVRAAQELRDARDRGDIDQSEYEELLEDLKRMDSIQLSADELDQQIAFNECIELLKSVPLP
jgi:cell division FtsZ-interacting protein ZapD